MTLADIEAAIRSCNRELENLRVAMSNQTAHRDRARALAAQALANARALLLEGEAICEEKSIDFQDYRRVRAAAADAADEAEHYESVAAKWQRAIDTNQAIVDAVTASLRAHCAECSRYGDVRPFPDRRREDPPGSGD